MKTKLLAQFLLDSEQEGWDYAIDNLDVSNDNNLKVLRDIYYKAYDTEEYKKSGDPDNFLCYNIRQFAMDAIYKYLLHEWYLKEK